MNIADHEKKECRGLYQGAFEQAKESNSYVHKDTRPVIIQITISLESGESV